MYTNVEWTAIGIGGALLISGAIIVSNSIFFPDKNSTPKNKKNLLGLNPNDVMYIKTPLGGKKSKRRNLKK